jgi:1-acyl-sn-glycerol-3-phosphate acyltransferase
LPWCRKPTRTSAPAIACACCPAAARRASRIDAKAGRALRGLRWSRLFVHAVHGALILRFVFPGLAASERRLRVQWWSAKLVRLCGVALRVEGDVPTHAEHAAMIAANHVSWLDIFALSAAWPTRFVAKSEIRDWPAAGWIAERAGTLFIRRERKRDIARIHEQIHEVLARGDCVGLFPEGTTSEGDTLLKFHASLFEPAIANGARVHPVAIRYRHADGRLATEMAYVGELSFMESMSRVLAQRGVTASVAFGEPVPCDRVADRREAASLTRARIASLLRLPVEDSPPGTRADPRGAPP